MVDGKCNQSLPDEQCEKVKVLLQPWATEVIFGITMIGTFPRSKLPQF